MSKHVKPALITLIIVLVIVLVLALTITYPFVVACLAIGVGTVYAVGLIYFVVYGALYHS